MNYDAAMLETPCLDSSFSSREIDMLARTIYESICLNGLFMLILAAKQKSILFMRLKPRPKDTVESRKSNESIREDEPDQPREKIQKLSDQTKTAEDHMRDLLGN